MSSTAQPQGLWGGLRPSDEAFNPTNEPALGSHMVTPRRGYTHHGIYVGRGWVIQYGGLSRGLHCGPVEEVPLSEFGRGRPVWIRSEESNAMERHEVVRRARLRLGENRYHLLTNNCEHFCEWCIRGESRSLQVDELRARLRNAWRRLSDFCAYAVLLRRRSAEINT